MRGQIRRMLEADATMAEAATRGLEQRLGWRIVQIDVEAVRHLEFDGAEGIPWTRQLPQPKREALRADRSPIDAAAGRIVDRVDDDDVVRGQIMPIAAELRQHLLHGDGWRDVPGRIEGYRDDLAG